MKKKIVGCLLGNVSAFITFIVLCFVFRNIDANVSRYWIIPFMVLTMLLIYTDYKEIRKTKNSAR